MATLTIRETCYDINPLVGKYSLKVRYSRAFLLDVHPQLVKELPDSVRRSKTLMIFVCTLYKQISTPITNTILGLVNTTSPFKLGLLIIRQNCSKINIIRLLSFSVHLTLPPPFSVDCTRAFLNL